MNWKVILRFLFIVLIINSPVLFADEPILSWHTFAGSVMDDDSAGIAVDPSGNIYLAGWSDANWGSPINPHSGGRDAFVAKLNSLGELEWNTFMGSSYEDRARAIAVDGNGNVYVVGYSEASWGAPGEPFLGRNAFAAKLNTNGALQWHKFMTPDGGTMGTAVAADAAGNVYVAGWGGWVWYTPPVEPFPDHDGAFVAKLNSSGVELWHAFMGSATPGYFDRCSAVAVASNGTVYVAGRSTKTWGSPINPHAGDTDAFAAKFDSSGFRQWNTFMGSSGYDSGWGIALDGSENVHVVGGSAATWGAPVNPHAGGSEEGDAFVAKLDSSGVRQWNTFMGAEGSGELGWAIAVDAGQNVYVTGVGFEPWGTAGGPPLTHPGGFVAELNRDGVLQWNTFLEAILTGIALDGRRNVYVSGGGDVDWGTPVNPKAGPIGSWDAFVAKIETAIELDIDIKPGSDPNSINLCSGGAVPIAILGSDTFDVYDIDTETLRFSEASVKVVGMKDPHSLCSYEDVNDDLFYDLVCRFLTADIAGIDGQSSSATVNGELLDGTSIEGTDSVNIVKDTCN